MIRIKIKWPTANGVIEKNKQYLTQTIGVQDLDWRWQWVIDPSNFSRIILIDIFDDSKQLEVFAIQMMWS